MLDVIARKTKKGSDKEVLILPIKKKWFDMIVSGEKKEEYREIKPYWTRRLLKSDIPFDLDKLLYKLKTGEGRFCKTVILKNGYRKSSSKIMCRVEIYIGQGKKEWGAEPNKEYYVLEIKEVIKK